MESTIKCGKYLAEHVKMTGSRFHDVCLGNAEFDNVSLANAKFHNINMSDINVSCVQWGGARFKDIGCPPNKEGKREKQRALHFENCDINDSTFKKCNLTNVAIVDCDVSGMKIGGIPVQEMLDAYRQMGSR